jgi:hypothetical protein
MIVLVQVWWPGVCVVVVFWSPGMAIVPPPLP